MNRRLQEPAGAGHRRNGCSMGRPPRRQQLLQVLGDLGVTKARHAPVDAAYLHRLCSLIPCHCHEGQPETLG
jgi:hypothetical protein